MPQDSSKVIVPGLGRFWTGPVDSTPPVFVISVPNNTTAGTFTITGPGGTTAAITFSPSALVATMKALAAALAALSGVGTDKVVVIPITAYSWMVFFDPTVTPGTITGTGTSLTPTGAITVVAPTTAMTVYSEMGHTSEDSPLQLNRAGGDVTLLGSWQQKGIESSTAAVTWSAAFNSLQGDFANMKQYYGTNAAIDAQGFLVPGDAPAATEQALLILIKGNGKAQLRHYPRASVIAADAQSFDTSALLPYPLQANFLSSNTLARTQGISQVGVAA